MPRKQQPLTTLSQTQQNRLQQASFGWKRVGIRTKILAPLIILMTLSLLGSIVGFTFSTSTTSNRFLDEQINHDSLRIYDILQERKRAVHNGAMVLSRNPDLVNGLQELTPSQGTTNILNNHALVVRDRFHLDQVMVLDTSGAKRLSLTHFSDASRIPFYEHESLARCSEQSLIHPIAFESYRLLVACAPIWANVQQEEGGPGIRRELVGVAYAVDDIHKMLKRIRRDLSIETDIQLADESPVLASLPYRTRQKIQAGEPISAKGYRLHVMESNLDTQPLMLLLLHSEQDINEIAYSGFRVMLLSSGMMLLIVLVVGWWLAREFTRPILKLSKVAQAVAAGDFSQRANLTHQDEIGQLGRVFDEATMIITELLEQRAQKMGELQAILQSMADGVLAVDADEHIVMINPVAAWLLGKDPSDVSDVIGQPLESLTTVDDPLRAIGLQHLVEQVRDTRANPDGARPDEHIAFGDRMIHLETAPIRGNNTITGAVVVLQDVTQAVEAERAKDTFIATASHEMRTPLSGLKGFVDLFYMTGTHNLNENQHMFLDTIKRQTDYMTQMVNDLLEVARFDQGTIRCERRWVSLEQVIEDVLVNLRPDIEQRRIDFEVKTEPDLPKIWIDSLHLKRILLNLFSNAIKYVHEGGEVRVWVYELLNPTLLPSSPEDQPWNPENKRSVVLEVEDNGVGINERDQQHIFERFFRSENSLSVEAGGTGLGLAITRSLVNLHNGQIGFWSVEDEGSCFWVRLPAPTVEPLDEDTLGRSESPPAPAPSHTDAA